MIKAYSDNKKIIIRYVMLLIYGCIAGYVLIKTTRMANPLGYLEDYYMSLRVTWLDYFINELKTTGIYTGLHRLYDHNAAMYLYLSHLNVFLGLEDALYTFFYTQLIFVCGCIALYPAIFYRITGNMTISLLSILFFKLYNPFSIFLLSDSYWISGISSYIGIPVLFFLFKDKWKNSNWLWVALLIGLSSAGNIFRSNSDLAIVAGLVILMIVKVIIPSAKDRKITHIVIAVAVCFVTIWMRSFFTATVPAMYQKVTDQADILPIKGPWHTMYIGLGWTENSMDLEYSDKYGYMDREHLLYDTTDGYYLGIESPEYIEAIKTVYFDTVKENFNEVLFSYIRKGVTAVYNSIKYSTLNALKINSRYYYVNYVGSFATIINIIITYKYLKKKLSYIEFRKRFTDSIIIALPLILLFFCCGILPGLVATPIVREYLFGAVSAIDCITLFTYIIMLNYFIEKCRLKQSKL